MEKSRGRRHRLIEALSVTSLCIVATIFYGSLFLGWVRSGSGEDIKKRVPGMDQRDEILARQGYVEKTVKIGESFLSFEGEPSTIAAEWPRFRGKHFDNISRETVQLNHDWGEEGPPVLWSIELGEGYAAPVVKHGRVYILDYMEVTREDALRCFSLDDGREIWRRSYRQPMKRNHGYSRTVCAVSEKHVVSFGPKCHVMCLDAISGDLIWGLDLVKDHGTDVPPWYAGQCPLIDNGMAVLGICGEDLVQGLDCETGKVLFRTPNPGKWKLSHSSIIPAVIAGKRMYVYSAIGGTCGISAEKEDLGALLWQTTDWDASVIAPSPVVLEDGRIHLTAGYGAGSIMLRVKRTDAGFAVETLFKRSPREMLACEQQTPIYYRGHLFGIMPKDAGKLARQFACYTPEGALVWASGKERRLGLGPFMVADEKFLMLDDDGGFTVAEVSTERYKELAHAKVLDGVDSWGPMTLVDGRLMLRDAGRLICLDLREEQK